MAAGKARAPVHWAPRVPRELVRRLYEADAAGLRDEALVEDVGCALYARCQSILAASAAQDGRVVCPACSGLILRRDREEALRCGACGWEMPWASYRGTYKGQQLMAGGAGAAFEGYIRRYGAASSYRDKLLAIDRLVYALHRSVRGDATAPAARNVIAGNLREIHDLLDGLAYGPGGEASRDNREEYLRAVQSPGGRSHLRRRGTAG